MGRRSPRACRPAHGPFPAAQPIEGIAFDRPPVVGRPVRPDDASFRLTSIAKTEMDPRQLAAGVATPDRQLAALHAVANPKLNPAADRIAVRTVLHRLQFN